MPYLNAIIKYVYPFLIFISQQTIFIFPKYAIPKRTAKKLTKYWRWLNRNTNALIYVQHDLITNWMQHDFQVLMTNNDSSR